MFKKTTALLLVLLSLYILNAFLFPFPKKNVPLGFKPNYGTTYSFEQAEWYGYNGREQFVKLLDRINFSWIRLPFYWDSMVGEDGNFNENFNDLEFALEEAQKRNVKVIIALGLKTPYYPEYHLPPNIMSQIKFGKKLEADHPVADDIITIDRKVVGKISKHENISHWQIENEPYLANVNNTKIGTYLIREEINAVKAEDKLKRPVILNHVGPAAFDKEWKSLLNLLGEDDSFGVNAYFKTQGTNLLSFSVFNKNVFIPWPKVLTWPVQSWQFLSPDYDGLKKELAGQENGLWVLEMQAEPYVRNLDYAKRGEFSFRAEDIIKADDFLKSKRVENVGLWGANFWIYRDMLGDSSWIDRVKSIVN